MVKLVLILFLLIETKKKQKVNTYFIYMLNQMKWYSYKLTLLTKTWVELGNASGIELKIHPTTQLINPLKIYLKAKKKKINHKKFHQLIITPLPTSSKKKKVVLIKKQHVKSHVYLILK